MATSTSSTRVGIPRPSAPNPTTNQTLQNVSVYKSLRSLTDMLNAQQTQSIKINFGSVATTASDGSPATYTQGSVDAVIVRVWGFDSQVMPPNSTWWVAGGGETKITHGLGRVPIGYWLVRNQYGSIVYDGDTAWDSTYIYLHTTDSTSNTSIMIF